MLSLAELYLPLDCGEGVLGECVLFLSLALRYSYCPYSYRDNDTIISVILTGASYLESRAL